MKESITALVPAYNEAAKIRKTITALKKIKEVKEIIVINDASTDNTAQVIKNLDVIKINLQKNSGKGNALNKGLAYANYDVIALVDADLGESAYEMKKLIRPILTDEVDMTVGKFPSYGNKAGLGLTFFLAQKGLNLLTTSKFKAPLSGQRVLSKEAIDYINYFASGFSVEVDLNIRLKQGGFKIKEIPVNMKHNRTKKDLAGFYHRGKQFKDILFRLIKNYKRC